MINKTNTKIEEWNNAIHIVLDEINHKSMMDIGGKEEYWAERINTVSKLLKFKANDQKRSN